MDFLKKIQISGLARLLGRRSAPLLQSTANPPIASPARDWNIILLVGAIALVAVMGAAGVFYSLENGSNASMVGSGTPQDIGISQSSLNAVLAHYQALDAEHAALLQHSTAVADPSAGQ